MKTMNSMTRYPIRRKHLWKGACLVLSLLYLASLLIFGYLKVIGEVLPFCFYDNFYYGVLYFVMFLYCFVGIELTNVPITKSQHRLWYTNKCLSCLVLCAELEALVQFVLVFGRVSFELEVDFVAGRYVYTLLGLGIVRVVTVAILVAVGTYSLNQIIEAKSYDPELFGSNVTFFSDFTIMHLYFYTAYIYDFALPLVMLISSVCYIYYKYMRL